MKVATSSEKRKAVRKRKLACVDLFCKCSGMPL